MSNNVVPYSIRPTIEIATSSHRLYNLDGSEIVRVNGLSTAPSEDKTVDFVL
jgi:hypothetical protein